MRKSLQVVVFLILAVCSAVIAQDTKVRFFGQPGFDLTENTKTKQAGSNFVGNNFVIFVTSQINERVSVLSETNFKLNFRDSSRSSFGVDIERLMVKYYVNDYLSLRFGRMYSPLGYWNTQYNLGLVLQPTIIRPRIIQAEHEGGLLPTRDGGLQIEGSNISSLRFSYKFLISNGLGRYGVRSASTNAQYDNTRYNSFAYTLNLMIEPIDNLKIFASGMYDEIKPGFRYRGFTPTSTLYAQLLNGGVAFMGADLKPEFIAEYYNISTKDSYFGNTSAKGGYVYAGYKLTDKIAPYAIFDYTDYKDFFVSSLNSFKLGFRYKFDANAVVKFEYEIGERVFASPTVTLVRDANGVPVFDANGNPQIILGRSLTYGGIYHGPRLQFAFAF